MAKKIRTTLGGDRLGSGNRNKVEMHNYYRSNHNLSCTRISSMAPGVLYPMYTQIGLTGDTFDIDLSAFIRTLPTEGPMFGAFKLQVDVFTADMRLYQAILHNNTTEIGFDMDKVLMPKMMINTHAENKSKRGAFSKSSLMYYLGMAGAGRSTQPNAQVERKINAIPMLAYYDIFKNYYSNKQEDNAYVITSGETTTTKTETFESTVETIEFFNIRTNLWQNINTINSLTLMTKTYFENNNISSDLPIGDKIRILGDNLVINNQILIEFYSTGDWINPNNNGKFAPLNKQKTYVQLEYVDEENSLVLVPPIYRTNSVTVTTTETTGEGTIRLQPFPLNNIDKMRKRLLTAWDLGEEIVIDKLEELLPYQTVVGTRVHPEIADGYQLSKNCDPMQGLVVKCYQSDWFNNWLDNEWVAKIAMKSNVNVSNGSFSIDALNFAKKTV